MPAVTFACPECGKVLRSAKAIPAGKKITCPTCAAVFPMREQDDEETAAAVSDKPRRPAAAPVRDDDDDEPRPRRRSRADDDEEADADRPRRKKAKAKGPRRSGRLGLLIGAGVVLLLLLGGGGTTAYFVWFHGVNRGSGNEDPLAFVPAGAEVIMGEDFAVLLNDAALGAQFEKGIREQGRAGDLFSNIKKETGLEYKELLAQTVVASDLDTLTNPVMVAGGMGGAPGQPPPPPVGGMQGGVPGRGGPGGVAPGRSNLITLIARSSRPFDQKKVVKACKNADHKKAHGKSYYEVNEGDFRTLFMPSNRVLIFSSLSAAELDALFASDGTTPGVSADTVALVRGVDKTTLWAAVPFDGKTRARFDEGLRGNPLLKEQSLLDPVVRGKGVAAWGALEGEQVTIGVNVACADAAAAGQVAQGAEKAWNEQKLQVTGLLALLAFQIPKTAKVAGELTGSLKFTSDGTVAKATASTTRASLTAAIEEVQAQQNAQNPGGFGPGRGAPPNPGPPGGFGPGRGKR